MADYENNENRTNGAKKAALGVAVALGGLAWQIAQNVIIDRGIRAVNDMIDDRKNKKKE